MSQAKSILLIHGAWMTPAGWDLFRDRYTERGYHVFAPPWPYEDVSIEQLRTNPRPELKDLTITRIVDHYENVIRQLHGPPIIIGHSTGGLVAQLLLDRGLGAAGVALDPIPMRGVPVTPRVLRSASPVLTEWGFWNKIMKMSFETFSTTFANGLPEEQKREAYEKYVVPTPGRIYLHGALGIGAAIHSGNPHRPPLLICVGSEDLTMPVAVARAAYNKQKKSPSRTDFKIFQGRSHFLLHEPGWQEVADYIIEWAETHERIDQNWRANIPRASAAEFALLQ